MFTIRVAVTLVLGLVLASFAMVWVDSAGLIPENFASIRAYDDTLTLASFAVYPLAWASAGALIWRVLPDKGTND